MLFHLIVKKIHFLILVFTMLSCTSKNLYPKCTSVDELPVESICFLGDNRPPIQISQETKEEVLVSSECLERVVKISELQECPAKNLKIVSSKRGSVEIYSTTVLKESIGTLGFFESADVLLMGKTKDSVDGLCLLRTELNLIGWVDCMKVNLGTNSLDKHSIDY